MPSCRELYLLIHAFSSITLKILNLQNRRLKIFAFHISKMLSSSLYTMLKLSKTTYPIKLFDYDCVTLYHPCEDNAASGPEL